MATITHQKVDTIPSWDATDLANAKAGNPPAIPPSATIADIVLSEDWNADHVLVLGADENFVTDAELASIGTAVQPGDLATVATTGDYDDLINKPTIPTGTIDGTLTTNELVYSVDANTVGSLAVATYPSLTEVSYVKGVTSAIQTQLNNKAGGTGTANGTNTGDQTSIVGITGTKAQFDTAVTDGNFLYVGDITQYTDEMAQDAVGGMVNTTLTYVDATPSLGVNQANNFNWTGNHLWDGGSGAGTGVTSGSIYMNTSDYAVFSILPTSATFGDPAGDFDSFTIEGSEGVAFYADTDSITTKVGIGTNSLSAVLTIEGTAEQVRTRYNSTNYMTTTIGSSGGATFNLVGTSPEFTFSDAVNVPDEAYGGGWNGSLEVPTKNAVYDKIEVLPQVTFSTIAVSGQSNVVADSATDTLTLVAGTNITITTNAATDEITINASGGGGSGESVSKAITQAAHGFTVGKVLYLNGTTYTLADKDAAATAEAVGIVSAVAGVNDFTLTTNGYVTGLTGLTAGVVYFLGDTGDLTATEPTAIGDISKPLFTADSTTSGYFTNMRGMEISDVGTGGSVNSVVGEVDFGFASGNEGDIATVTVAATWADSANPIVCSPIATATADHDPEDYALETITAYAANIVNGVGFDIIARAPFGTWGRYNVNAIGV